MEDTFLGQNPEWNNANQRMAYNATMGPGTIERWIDPSLAEWGEFQRENYLMDKGNAFNEYMFDKANQWNSASAQMQRGIEAGINPMLLAAGISGTGATAAPMQSQGASVGMNNAAESPFDMINKSMNSLDTLMSGTDKLGKLVGFGKENIANIKIATETAKKIQSETNINKQEYRRLKHTFQAFCRQAEANAAETEQNIKNLQELFDKYHEETKLLKEQQNLVTEEINTQKQETKQKEYQNWEYKFKKQFRETFGVQLNDSDASMLAQLILNGHGQELIDALGKMVNEVTKGIEKHMNENNPILETQHNIEDYVNKQKNKFKESYYRGQYRALSREKKFKLQSEGIYNEWQYAHMKMNPESYY